jgi:hypothetical protein
MSNDSVAIDAQAQANAANAANGERSATLCEADGSERWRRRVGAAQEQLDARAWRPRNELNVVVKAFLKLAFKNLA